MWSYEEAVIRHGSTVHHNISILDTRKEFPEHESQKY